MLILLLHQDGDILTVTVSIVIESWMTLDTVMKSLFSTSLTQSRPVSSIITRTSLTNHYNQVQVATAQAAAIGTQTTPPWSAMTLNSRTGMRSSSSYSPSSSPFSCSCSSSGSSSAISLLLQNKRHWSFSHSQVG